MVIRLLLSILGCVGVLCDSSQEDNSLGTNGLALDAQHIEQDRSYSSNSSCPSADLISTHYKCKVGGEFVNCTLRECCKNYVYVAGRCIPRDVDPCTLKLCEQSCEVYEEQVMCTCYPGYRYNEENRNSGITPICEDVDECLENNGDCEQICVNVLGSHKCDCVDNYTLNPDNRSCDPLPDLFADGGGGASEANRQRCYAGCEAIANINKHLRKLQEQVNTLSAAAKLTSFSRGPPGPPGSPGGNAGHSSGSKENDDYESNYNSLDSYVPVEDGFCRCKRGPVGPPGASGIEGPKGDAGPRGYRGPKGPEGSLDIMLLLLNDLRFDIRNIEEKVYNGGEKPERFNLQRAWRVQKDKERSELMQDQLYAYTPETMERRGDISISVDGESGEIIHGLSPRVGTKMETTPMPKSFVFNDLQSSTETSTIEPLEDDDVGDYHYINN